jgi:hypothetical protein
MKSERLSYEYWWQSSKVYRSTWTRADATRMEWHTVDGKKVYKTTGDRLFYFEQKLENTLVLIGARPGKIRLG